MFQMVSYQTYKLTHKKNTLKGLKKSDKPYVEKLDYSNIGISS